MKTPRQKRADRRKAGLPKRDRVKGARGNLHKTPEVELTDREKKLGQRYSS